MPNAPKVPARRGSSADPFHAVSDALASLDDAAAIRERAVLAALDLVHAHGASFWTADGDGLWRTVFVGDDSALPARARTAEVLGTAPRGVAAAFAIVGRRDTARGALRVTRSLDVALPFDPVEWQSLRELADHVDAALDRAERLTRATERERLLASVDEWASDVRPTLRLDRVVDAMRPLWTTVIWG